MTSREECGRGSANSLFHESASVTSRGQKCSHSNSGERFTVTMGGRRIQKDISPGVSATFQRGQRAFRA